MSCNCNESAFTKLRECWSRHHRTGMEGECQCCTSGLKSRSKVKGKFGIAYVIDTPNRKCKPCGWEVEFNDTLSEVESNCKKMMHWVTCPPLGECQNNQTNVCCCSENAKKLLNQQPPCCCQCTEKDKDLCRCCKQKKKKNVGDGCCKKEPQRAPCCCARPANKTQCSCLKANEIKCCSRLTNNKNQCCCKVKNNRKSSCCRAQDGQTRYLKSIRRCAECCCTISNEEKNKLCCQDDNSDAECCCSKSKKKPKCCCQNSDSDSSLEYDECDKQQDIKDCSCDCTGCKCNKRNKQKQDKNRNYDRKEKPPVIEGANKSEHKNQQPKNLQRPEPKKERRKSNEKTPFTLVARNLPIKEPPDTGQEQDVKHSGNNLHQITTIKTPKDESIEKLQESLDSFVFVDAMETIDQMPQMETEINTIVYQNEKNSNVDKNKDREKKKLQTKKNRFKQKPTLLQRIQQEHKKEMDTVHPKQESTAVAEEQAQGQPTMNTSPETHAKKRKLHQGPDLLNRIKQERKKEMEAIHPNN